MDTTCPLRDLRQQNRNSLQFREQLGTFLSGDGRQNVISSLEGDDLSWLVECLDSVLTDVADLTSRESQVFLEGLKELCDAKGVLPKSYELSESLFECVYEGFFNGSRVRIRRVRVCEGVDPRKVKETLRHLAVTSKYLKHRTIVPILGITFAPLQLISGWTHCEDLPGYVRKNPFVDRRSLLFNIAEGLEYLHSCNLILGDLKGSNIFVDEAGHPRITDYGLSMITQDLDSIRNVSAGHDAGPRWVAPEILNDHGTYDHETDVFSFAGVAIEVFTGTAPFGDISPCAARSAVAKGTRPPRPTHPTLTDSLWTLTQGWWNQKAQLRPRALRIACSLGIPAWKRLIDNPSVLDEQERISLIMDFFSDQTEVVIPHRDDAQPFVDIVDEVLDKLTPPVRRKCLSALCKTCGCHGLLPRSVQIPLSYDRKDIPLGHGGFSSVWGGEYKGNKVAIKVLNVYSTSDIDKITRTFCREVMTWRTLRHQNVLPLLGVKMGERQFAMASELMANGNIIKFVKTYRDANRFELLEDVTKGLIYMHGEGLIHGDLKGANILMDQYNHARLADFGLIAIVSENGVPMTTKPSADVGSKRWMSPELFDQNHSAFSYGQRTNASDCYALGMVILEVLSEKIPFAPLHNGFSVQQKVSRGEHPERPKRSWFTDELWNMLKLCWSLQLKERPLIRDVSEFLRQASPTWIALPPDMEIDAVDVSPSTVLRGPSAFSVNTSSSSRKELMGQAVRRADTASSDGNIEAIPAILVLGPDEVSSGNLRDIHEEHEHQGVIVPGTPQSTTASISLKKIANWNETSQGIEQVLAAAFEADDYLECIKNFYTQNIDPLSYINNLDKIIGKLETDLDLRQRCIRSLCGTCSFYGILPTSHAFTGKLSKSGAQPIASSVACDFWRLKDEENQDEVFAVKSLRVWKGGPAENIKEKYWKEVIVSKQMSHPNILSIEGVAPELFEFCMVSQWMENGNILEYAETHPKVDRLQLLIGVVHGLDYLHDNGIVHGDLKSPNILIDATGNPRLYDFTNCSFTDNANPVNVLSPAYSYTIRWSSPEQLGVSGQAPEPTKMSDIYSLSMVIVELVTGKVPFPEYTDQNVIVMVVKGGRPSRPRFSDTSGITLGVWEVAQECWNAEADKRPEVGTVLQRLGSLTNYDGKNTQGSRFPWWKR